MENTMQKRNPDDVVRWYPMRATYNRSMKTKEILDGMKVETYVPMVLTSYSDDAKAVPSVPNLIFIHSTKNIILSLKAREDLSQLRFMVSAYEGREGRVLVVPDKQMDDFIRISSVSDSSSFPIDEQLFKKKDLSERMVRVTEGPFRGVEGYATRIKGERVFVALISGVSAIGTTAIPHKYLQPISRFSWEEKEGNAGKAKKQ